MSKMDSDFILVKASAGSGKTYELTGRLISILISGEDPSSILATTFTKKAAAEIMDRVLSRMISGLRDWEGFYGSVRDFLLDPNIEQASLERVLQNTLKSQSRLSICTLDAFFGRMARSFSFELGLSPSWSTRDPEADLFAHEQLIDLLLEELDEQAVELLFTSIFAGDSRVLVRKALAERLFRTYDVYRESFEKAWKWLSNCKSPSISELDNLIEKLKSCSLPLTGKKEPSKNYVKALAKILELLSSRNWSGFLEQTLVSYVHQGNDKYSQIKIPDDLTGAVSELVVIAKRGILADLDRELKSLYQILVVMDKLNIDMIRNFNSLGFSDIKHMLMHEKLQDRLSELYYRLDCQYRHVLLDEFQDTSLLEWNLVLPMISEVVTGGQDRGRSFFCVGDVKQAIYGWRGGVAEIFASIPDMFQNISVMDRNESRRCAPEILTFCNLVFQNLDRSSLLTEHSQVLESWNQRYKTHSSAGEQKLGSVKVRRLVDPESEDESFSKVDLISNQICKLLESYPEHFKVGVLLRSNTLIPELTYNLRQNGIAVQGHAKARISDSAFICFIIGILEIIDQPANTVVWEFLSRSIFAGAFKIEPDLVTEDRGKFISEMRALYFQLGLKDFLFYSYDKCRHLCSLHDIKRYRYLMSSLNSNLKLEDKYFADLISSLKNLGVTDHSSAKVSIMTIHKSKGLEFDLVILPDLAYPLLDLSKERILYAREDNLSQFSKVTASLKQGLLSYFPEIDEIYKINSQNRLLEELSVLYVALTRAKYAMEIFLSPSGAKARKYTCEELLIESLELSEKAEGEICYSAGIDRFCSQSEDQETEGVLEAEVLDFKLWQKNSELVATEGTSLSNLLALEKGKALHRKLSRIAWVDSSYNFDGLVGAELRQLFYKERYEGFQNLELLLEAPMIYVADSYSRQLQMDRVVLCSKKGLVEFVEIVDFKTDQIEACDLDRFTNDHREQLYFYREQIALLTGINFEKIRCTLASVCLDRLITIE